MKIPIIYQASHFILGSLAIKYKWIIIIFLVYQFLQLYFNRRLFLLNVSLFPLDLSNSFKIGNNLNHTIKMYWEIPNQDIQEHPEKGDYMYHLDAFLRTRMVPLFCYFLSSMYYMEMVYFSYSQYLCQLFLWSLCLNYNHINLNFNIYILFY